MAKTKNVKPAENISSEQELKSSLDFTRSRSDQFAVIITEAFGSITFLLVCVIFFTCWIIGNLGFFSVKPFDPFPFPVLDMIVSIFAIILSVSVLINQNRQGRIDKIKQQVEFEVNVRAENEITKILTMLHEIHLHLGLGTKKDQELEEMKTTTDIKLIHKALDEQESGNTLAPDNE